MIGRGSGVFSSVWLDTISASVRGFAKKRKAASLLRPLTYGGARRHTLRSSAA